MPKPMIRNNAGRFQKYASVYLTKRLREIAEKTEHNVSEEVAKKLEETYKTNVELSYGPRSERGREVEAYNKSRKALEDEDRKLGIKSPRRGRKRKTYIHTGTFLGSIYTVIENHTVKIKFRNRSYPNGGKSVKEVYTYLTEGTKGGGMYPYHDKRDPDGTVSWAYNYPTPAHLFEEHTKLQMKGYLNSLERDIKSR